LLSNNRDRKRERESASERQRERQGKVDKHSERGQTEEQSKTSSIAMCHDKGNWINILFMIRIDDVDVINIFPWLKEKAFVLDRSSGKGVRGDGVELEVMWRIDLTKLDNKAFCAFNTLYGEVGIYILRRP
jgi:hypothetical protein